MNKSKIAKVIINTTLITIISIIFVYIVATYKSQEILLYKYCTIKNYLQKKTGYIGFNKNQHLTGQVSSMVELMAYLRASTLSKSMT